MTGPDEATPWEGEVQSAVETFATQCRSLSNSNPYDLRALQLILRSLVGELRDQGFAPTEIRNALFSALLIRT